MKCFEGNNHIGKLTEICYFQASKLEARIVRWCPVCGAIVVDVESDGRTHPGRLMKMRFPSWGCNDA